MCTLFIRVCFSLYFIACWGPNDCFVSKSQELLNMLAVYCGYEGRASYNVKQQPRHQLANLVRRLMSESDDE